MEWQPIETAPKDGTAILVYFKSHQEYAVIFFEDGVGWIDDYSAEYSTQQCDIWQPLPEPPQEGR